MKRAAVDCGRVADAMEMPVENDVVDDASEDETTVPQSYDISSYGADFDVDGLVRRLRNDHIYIPSFQRDYVWNLRDASRLVESLLLGLPIPGIFLAKEPESQRLLVIDGQQRLKTLRFFMDGLFNPREGQKSHRVFRLLGVQPQFDGRSFEELDERDKNRLRDTIIHATIIKQESPSDDDTSVYHVFERLNTGGRKLLPQEIRSAIFHGGLISLLQRLNRDPHWREIFGPESSRMKDQELILRFLAMHFEGDSYEKPMSEFLNRFSKKYRNPTVSQERDFAFAFESAINAVAVAVGSQAFRPERALNAAVFDAAMVGLAQRLRTNPEIDFGDLAEAYGNLLSDPDFKAATSIATSDASNVSTRLQVATALFAGI